LQLQFLLEKVYYFFCIIYFVFNLLFLFYTNINDQTANWLLFSGVLVAAFRSRLAKISRRPSARVPHGQGGMALGPCPAAGTPTKASGSSHHSENRFPHPRSTPAEKGSRKRLPSISS